jgi:hypothetical protein
MAYPKNVQEVLSMRWLGKISPNVEATMRLNDAHLPDPKRECRCGNILSMNDIADREIGSKLGIALQNIEAQLAWTKEWNANIEKALKKDISLDKFFTKQLRLWSQYEAKDWGAKDVSYSADAICQKCQTNLGKLTVILRIVDAPEAMDVTRSQLIDLETSNEMIAYTSKRMNFANIEELKQWLDYDDAERAKALLKKTIAEFNGLRLPYEVSRITQKLSALIDEIDTAIHERKIEWINAVEKVVRERVVIIT